MQVDSAANITLKVDNNIVLATRQHVKDEIKKLDSKFLPLTAKAADSNKLGGKDSSEFALKSEISDGVKIGSYLLWSSESVTPSGFLVCDGRSLAKSEYAELFNVIGYTYGGSGESFNIPNFADGKFFRSVGGNAAPIGEAQNDAIRNITGSFGRVIAADSSISGVFSSNGFLSAMAQVGAGRDGLNINIDVSKAVPTANENRPYNMSVVILIKAKDVKEPTSGQIDESIYATEVKAGITKLKNSITGNSEDTAVTEKAVNDRLLPKTLANTQITFDKVTNKITISGLTLSKFGLEIGDIVQISGSQNNNTEFSIDEIINDNEIIVNKAHANGTASKALVNETTNCTIKLLCKWFNAPLGLGQGWIDVVSKRQANVVYKNDTGRSIVVSTYGHTVPLLMSSDGVTWVSSPTASTSFCIDEIIPNGYFYKTTRVGSQWIELR
ncbi:Phage Tail Collar Domain [Campylobacter hyointestinalis]|uniref:phage tail protein n=1 Tax=Campylobacter hyointestinalis TaxID=198 RepID=UPI0007240A59|nr:phage tail protein [Campylobacter hyointestinalis]PPB55477.1 hypothetical protein CDQ67_05395 [Campylobacter hyointestinalis subsp. hyointestinalis]CUU82998.1 Phage Tail Collar Domain [Campylobacter hyointestinalis]